MLQTGTTEMHRVKMIIKRNREFYREVLSDYDKKNLVSNIVGAMSGISGPKKDEIVNRQLCHFFRADIGLGMVVAKGLGVDAEKAMPKQHSKESVTV
jgi:catalase